MTGRQWFRRDVLIPLLFLGFFGYGIYWIRQRMLEQPEIMDSKLFNYAFIAALIIYFLLLVLTIRHAMASYTLERFNPGNSQSLKRLRKLHRFHLSSRAGTRMKDWAAPSEDIARWLVSLGYQPTARTPHGRVFVRRRPLMIWQRPAPVDRVFVLRHNLMNVLMIDQLLKDSIRYIKQQHDSPSPRNMLILLMDRDDENEAVSAAAGVVNFLGKFRGGSLGVILLDIKHGRMYYPIDRSLLSINHRHFQNKIRLRLIHWLQFSQADVRKKPKPEISGSGQASAIRFISLDSRQVEQPTQPAETINIKQAEMVYDNDEEWESHLDDEFSGMTPAEMAALVFANDNTHSGRDAEPAAAADKPPENSFETLTEDLPPTSKPAESSEASAENKDL